MKVIGVTGGVGSGKSEILHYVQAHYRCRVLLSDDAARKMEEPGGALYEPLLSLLGRGGLVLSGGQLDRKEMARRIFADPALLQKVDALVHPAVKSYILDEIAAQRAAGKIDYFFLEAALLLENGFAKLVDSMWFIYCAPDERRKRLKASRGYSDEKINHIMKSQLSDEEFRAGCDVVIDNSGSFAAARAQVDDALRELGR